jgi:hypothetical protein
MDADCLFCDVGTGFLHIIYIMVSQTVVPVPLLVGQPCLLVRELNKLKNKNYKSLKFDKI